MQFPTFRYFVFVFFLFLDPEFVYFFIAVCIRLLFVVCFRIFSTSFSACVWCTESKTTQFALTSPHRTPIAKAFVDSSMQLNYSHVNYNSGDQIGVSYLQASTKNGWRQTAAKAFLSRIKDRPNLDISLRSWATKLLFNAHHDHVKGVKFYRNRHEYNVKVRKEVIVSAGAFQSPKLLMLSGIGPADHLNELNIDLVKVMLTFLSTAHEFGGIRYNTSSTLNIITTYFPYGFHYRICPLVRRCTNIWPSMDQYSLPTMWRMVWSIWTVCYNFSALIY